ncbi:MAG: phosphoglucomutase/phosphomannomutase family protein [Dehalococcoidia bacterium]|nr:phosphoglucomutase/phosphomannomutase family protein [Dehalococcoidia bacterium]
MPAEINFGTDGWRAIIAEDFTFENVRYAAAGIAQYINERHLGKQGLVIGYDTRFLSKEFAEAVVEVLTAAGIKVYLCDKAAPTPVISYNIITHKAAGGIVITSSHNPPEWNGLKYKPEYAGSSSPEINAALETKIAAAQKTGQVKRISLENSKASGLMEIIDPDDDYIPHILKLVDINKIRNSGLHVVVDPMFGAGAGYLKNLIRGKTKVTEIQGTRNPAFPGMKQPEPITINLSKLMAAVRRAGADVGLATDGDADRLGVVDEKGEFVTQLQIYGLLAYYVLEVRGERGPMVKSITTTSMINRLGEIYNVPVIETPVGFKYIAPVMMSERAIIGGEESGGYGFAGHIPERDGVLSSLYFLDLMVRTKKRPSQLLNDLYKKVGPHYYDRLDVPFDPKKKESVMQKAKVSPGKIGGVKVKEVNTLEGVRYMLEDGSWGMVRFSGTEPLVRIYCETSSPKRVKECLSEIKSYIGL